MLIPRLSPAEQQDHQSVRPASDFSDYSPCENRTPTIPKLRFDADFCLINANLLTNGLFFNFTTLSGSFSI